MRFTAQENKLAYDSRRADYFFDNEGKLLIMTLVYHKQIDSPKGFTSGLPKSLGAVCEFIGFSGY